jgi:hypothetical protein
MPAKGTRKKIAETLDDLTIPQRTFVTNLTDVTSPTFGNFTEAFLTTGLKHGRSTEATAIRMLANKNVLNVLCNHVELNRKEAAIRQETAKERIWRELEHLLTSCKIHTDHTNWAKAIELMGKFHQLWSDKVTISVETYEKMSTEHMAELRELSKLRLLGSNAEPIQACFETVSRETLDIETQDIVGDDDKTDNTSIDTVHNDIQVVDSTEVM